MNNQIITSDLGKALFKFKHDMPMSLTEKQLIKQSPSAMMAAAMYEDHKIRTRQSLNPLQFELTRQAAASEEVSIEEIFVNDISTEERLFSLQIEQDKEDEQYYITWYFIDHSAYISTLLIEGQKNKSTPTFQLFYVDNLGLDSEERQKVSEIAITGELSPESPYNFKLSPKDALEKQALKQGEFVLEIHYV